MKTLITDIQDIHIHGPTLLQPHLALILTLHPESDNQPWKDEGLPSYTQSDFFYCIYFFDKAPTKKVSSLWVHNFEEKKAPFTYNTFHESL